MTKRLAKPEAGATLGAVVHARLEEAALVVAGVNVLDRLLVALDGAGAGPVAVVSDGTLPPTPRARERGVAFEVIPRAPSRTGPVLVARAALLVDPEGIATLGPGSGRLADASGRPLPIGIVPPEAPADPDSLEGSALVRAPGLAVSVRDAAQARAAAGRLWASLESPLDGLMDRWVHRPLGRPLARGLATTAVTPNLVTAIATAVGLGAALLLALGTHAAGILGALVFVASAVLDCVDGDLARATLRETPCGARFDIGADQVVHVALLAGIALGLERRGSDAPLLALAVAGAAGVLLCFLRVLRFLRLPEARRSRRATRLVRVLGNRDFAYVLLLLAVLDRLDVFLWLVALGAHAFWIALALPDRGRREAP